MRLTPNPLTSGDRDTSHTLGGCVNASHLFHSVHHCRLHNPREHSQAGVNTMQAVDWTTRREHYLGQNKFPILPVFRRRIPSSAYCGSI